MQRFALVLASLGLAAGLARGADCPFLLAAPIGEGVLVLAAEDEAPSREGPVLALDGSECPTWGPLLTRRWRRSAAGEWSLGGSLPGTTRGGIFGHGGRAWLVRLPLHSSPVLGPSIEISPLDDRFERSPVSIPREPAARSVALAGLDDWHFLLVQALPEGELVIDEHTSYGPGAEIERTASLSTRTAWPPGTRLVGAAGRPGSSLVLGRAPSGALVAGEATDGVWRDLPELAAPSGAGAVPLRLGESALVALLQASRLELWRLAGLAWERVDAVDLPARPRAWTAIASATGPPALSLLVLDGDVLRAWRWTEEGFRRESVPQAQAPSVVEPPPLSARPAARARSGRRTVVLLGCAAGVLVVLILGALALRRLRRGPQ